GPSRPPGGRPRRAPAAGAARSTRTSGTRAAEARAAPRRRRRRESGRRSPRPSGGPTARRRGRPRRPAAGQGVGEVPLPDSGLLRNAAVSLLVRIVRSGGPTFDTALLPTSTNTPATSR